MSDARESSRWPRRLLGGFVGLVVVAGLAWSYLTAREPVPEHSDYRIDVGELRALASELPGAAPAEMRTQLVAETSLPRAGVFAGESFAPQAFVHQVFQVRWAAGEFILVDAGFPEPLMGRMSGGTFNPDGYAKVQRAMARARQIVVTHEHFDHLGGVSTFQPETGLAGRLQLTGEQLANTKALDEAGVPAAMRQSLAPLAFDRLVALAPGVVLQKAPGHTPGSVLVYVRTDRGREYLFVGDVAWHLDQIRQLHYRPRLVTDFFLGEHRARVLAQFRSLFDLMREHPEVAVVVSHDPDERRQMLSEGLLVDGLVE